MYMAMYHIETKREFIERVLNSDKIVLVDFWATWCPPCRAMAPILDHLAEKYDDVFDVASVDVEKNAEMAALAAEYKVRGIPNMTLFKKGTQVDTMIGMTAQPVLEAAIAKLSKATEK